MEDNQRLKKYIQLLEANKNIILTGAPGTGKTHLAKAIAEEMEAEYEFIQFHPSYDYTDFVEGLRPTPPDQNGNIGFERKDGAFKEFCKKALYKINIKTYDYGDSGLFVKCYYELVDDIKSGKLEFIPLKRIQSKKVSVTSDYSIKFQNSTDNSNNIVYLNKLFKLYKKYPTLNKLEGIGTLKPIKDIIGEGSNSYYWGILREVIRRKEEYTITKDDTNSQNNLVQNDFINNKNRFVFIIDEINRGEISKIFGELFFSIDPGYRGEKGLVKTQYQNLITDESDPFYEGFYVPENVYLIGTMNDIDRSVESMDFAMRRRFAWIEVKADENTEMLDEKLSDMKDEIVSIMKRLNAAIWDEDNNTGIEGLSAAYHIGGSYFSKLSFYLNKEHTNKQEAYEILWNNHLKGILFEYLRGTINAIQNLNMLEQVYFNHDVNYDTE